MGSRGSTSLSALVPFVALAALLFLIAPRPGMNMGPVVTCGRLVRVYDKAPKHYICASPLLER
jgi:hypothetical protein